MKINLNGPLRPDHRDLLERAKKIAEEVQKLTSGGCAIYSKCPDSGTQLLRGCTTFISGIDSFLWADDEAEANRAGGAK